MPEHWPPPSPVPGPPPEPVQVRERLGRTARQEPGQARLELEEGRVLADYLWVEWAADLEPLGIARPLLVEMLGRWSRELWLWLMEERQWAEVAALIYGSLLRRAPR